MTLILWLYLAFHVHVHPIGPEPVQPGIPIGVKP